MSTKKIKIDSVLIYMTHIYFTVNVIGNVSLGGYNLGQSRIIVRHEME